jgi:FMN-dependent NADH-azoreductase
MKLLHIDASATGPHSASGRLSAAVVERLVQANPALEVVYRDLEAHPIPHVDGRSLADLQDNPVLREFLDADVLVIGAPMHNVAIPSQLKAWIDHILVADKTFRYTETEVRGLAGGKSVIIAADRVGADASGGPLAASDFGEPHLKTLFQFMGIEDVSIVGAEGVATLEGRSTAAQVALGLAA